MRRAFVNAQIPRGVPASTWLPKKDGTTRPCRDYCCLNTCTIPHIHDFTADLARCIVFSKIDLVKGYHQVPVRAEDVPKMAIAMPFGLFEFIWMLFGLKNATQTFQRLMDNITSQLKGVFVYLDVVLVVLPSAAQHERDLRELFGTLQRFGLVLNINKCIFGVRELEFLRQSVSEHGISPLKEKSRGSTTFRAHAYHQIAPALPKPP